MPVNLSAIKRTKIGLQKRQHNMDPKSKGPSFPFIWLEYFPYFTTLSFLVECSTRAANMHPITIAHINHYHCYRWWCNSFQDYVRHGKREIWPILAVLLQTYAFFVHFNSKVHQSWQKWSVPVPWAWANSMEQPPPRPLSEPLFYFSRWLD